jgi:hypothetical protein
MATTLNSAQSKGSLGWDLRKDPAYGSTVIKDIDGDAVTRDYAYNGTGTTGVANVQYRAKLAIAGATTATIDLTPLLDDFGNSQACARVWDLFVRCLDATQDATSTTDRVSVGGTGNTFAGHTDTATTKIYVPAGGFLHLNGGVSGNGFPVTATTGDTLKINNEHATNQAIVLVTLIGKAT